MGWKNQLTKTPYLVLFIVLISVGVGTASALITITLSGDVVITGFLDMTGDKITNVGIPTVNTDAATKGYVDSSPTTDTLASIGCTTDQIAKFDGNNWVCVFDTSGNHCGPGFYVAGFDSTGGLACIPNADRITKVNTGFISPTDTISLDKGADNLPAIAYSDSSDNNLRVVACNDAACTAPTITKVNTGSISPSDTISLDKGADNLPAIAYSNSSDNNLRVVACNDAACTAPTITKVNTGFISSTDTISLDKGADNLPAIAYSDSSDFNLRIVACNDAACTAPTITKVNTGFISPSGSISLDKGADNLPAIAYSDNSDFNLRVVACNDAACTAP